MCGGGASGSYVIYVKFSFLRTFPKYTKRTPSSSLRYYDGVMLESTACLVFHYISDDIFHLRVQLELVNIWKLSCFEIRPLEMKIFSIFSTRSTQFSVFNMFLSPSHRLVQPYEDIHLKKAIISRKIKFFSLPKNYKQWSKLSIFWFLWKLVDSKTGCTVFWNSFANLRPSSPPDMKYVKMEEKMKVDSISWK